MRWGSLSLCSLGLVAGGCLAAPIAQRGTPLYPTTAAPVPATRVARLTFRLTDSAWNGTTLIHAVDGRDVSTLAAPFELLPGCHVVETVKIPMLPHRTGGTTGPLGPSLFTLQMRAGHEYTVTEAFEPPGELIEDAAFRTIEHDPVSGQTAEILPATPLDLEICRASIPAF